MRIFWLDLAQVREALVQTAEQLGQKHVEIEAVWLFGSLARGEAVPGSDADLLMILRDTTIPFLDRAVHYRPDSCGIPMDIVAYTVAEIENMRTEGNAFIQQVEKEAVFLFERQKGFSSDKSLSLSGRPEG